MSFFFSPLMRLKRNHWMERYPEHFEQPEMKNFCLRYWSQQNCLSVKRDSNSNCKYKKRKMRAYANGDTVRYKKDMSVFNRAISEGSFLCILLNTSDTNILILIMVTYLIVSCPQLPVTFFNGWKDKKECHINVGKIFNKWLRNPSSQQIFI